MEEVISTYGLPALIAIGSALVGAFFSYREFRKKAYDHAKEMIDLSPETAKMERDLIRKDVDELKLEMGSIQKSIDKLTDSELKSRLLKLMDKVQYYKHLGYCPLDMKMILKPEFERYFEDGGNTITKTVIDEIMKLPDERKKDE